MRIIVNILCCLALCACSMEGITKESVHPVVMNDYYLPYVVSAAVPRTVSTSEEPIVTLQLAANSPEGILNGVGDWFFAVNAGVDVDSTDIWITPWIYDTPRTGEVEDEISVNLLWLAPGEYTVYIQTADSLETSAVFAEIPASYFSAPEPEGTHYLSYPLTVLEADEEETAE